MLVARHPLGVNLQVGENGCDLSGGQRQLVALVRSLIARPRTLSLDEPTSARDAQTESLFIEHLKQASAGQTLVVVTYRTSLLALGRPDRDRRSGQGPRSANFAFGSAALTPSTRQELNRFLDMNRDARFQRVTVTGYIDSQRAHAHRRACAEPMRRDRTRDRITNGDRRLRGNRWRLPRSEY